MKNQFLAALFATALLTAPLARADDFANPTQIATAPDAATPDLSGVKCVLRAQNGQSKFRMGETIRLIASFTSDQSGYKINRFVQGNRGMATLGAVKVTPEVGVIDPLGEIPAPTMMSVNGYVPEPVMLGKKPVEFPFDLNDWARFDQTGAYQVTLATSRVFLAKPGDGKSTGGVFFGSDSNVQITSEPLQIEITPADETWSDQQIELTREFWKKNANTPSYRRSEAPDNDISFIGTRAAMTAIIEHLSQNTAPRSSEDDTYLFRTGLIGFADRDWLLGEMKRVIEQPNSAVTQGFFGVLTELESLRNAPRPAGADATRVKYDKNANGKWIPQQATPAQQKQTDWEKQLGEARAAATADVWQQVAASTPAKTEAARAMTIHTLLELAWQSNLEKEAPIKAQLPQLIAQLAPIFDQLPPLPRAYLLGAQWDRIKSPAFAPALERSRSFPFDPNDYAKREAANLTLKRLAELNPKLGRAQIIAQIQSPNPNVGFEALSSLPDATLPALDDVLATNYIATKGAYLDLSAQLLWRYASPAVLPRIKANYEEFSDSNFTYSVPTLAYFMRVNPGYGAPKIAAYLRKYGHAQYISLLSAVAALEPGPELEALAIANLTNAGEGAAVDSAKTLALIGSSTAKTALMARLRNPEPVAYPKVRARIEPKLVLALADAQGWLCGPTQLREIRDLCQTNEGRQVADQYLQARSDEETFVVNYSSGTREYWSVDRYNGTGMETLRAKLAQFPRGTEFFWQGLERGPDAQSAFESTRKWGANRGLKVESYEKIGARRKALGLN